MSRFSHLCRDGLLSVGDTTVYLRDDCDLWPSLVLASDGGDKLSFDVRKVPVCAQMLETLQRYVGVLFATQVRKLNMNGAAVTCEYIRRC